MLVKLVSDSSEGASTLIVSKMIHLADGARPRERREVTTMSSDGSVFFSVPGFQVPTAVSLFSSLSPSPLMLKGYPDIRLLTSFSGGLAWVLSLDSSGCPVE